MQPENVTCEAGIDPSAATSSEGGSSNGATTPRATKGKGGKRANAGAPPRNANAVKHGRRGVLTMSRAPDRAKHTYRIVAAFRTQLTREVAEMHGEPSLLQSGMVLTAVRLETAVKLIEAWGRRKERTELEMIEAAREAAEFSGQRDKVLEKLLSKPGKNGRGGMELGEEELFARQQAEMAEMMRERDTEHSSGPSGDGHSATTDDADDDGSGM